MNTEDDGRDFIPGAGRPVLTVVPPPDPAPELKLHKPKHLEPLEPRSGDTDVGRPAQAASDQRPMTADDEMARAALELAIDDEQMRIADGLVESDPTGLSWLGWFASPLAYALAFGTIGVFGVFAFNQSLQLIDTLAHQPVWAQWVGYTGLGVFAACILIAIGRLFVLYLRLRENRQLRVKGLRELNNRSDLRALAVQKSAEARQRIERYMNEFPLGTERERRALAKLGLSDEAQQRLADVRAALCDRDKFGTTDQWFAKFRDEFQSVIDAAAEARVRYWSNRAWVVTAVAPNALIDSGATLFYTFSMLADLCTLYNLRAGRAGTAVLMGRTMLNAYVAGQGPEWEKIAEEQYNEMFQAALHSVGIGISANVVGKVVGKVGAKVTTGYLNGLLMSRLGKYAARLLRPVT